MSSAGHVDLFVDTDKLRDLGREIQLLINLLHGMDHCIAVDADSMGGYDVSDAVTQFMRRWQGSRQGLADDLAGCLKYVQMAMNDYDRTERSITNANVGALSDRTDGKRGQE